MGFDVLLLGYISIKRGGAQHAVVHADRAACVCDGAPHGGREQVFFEKQGSALTGSCSRLTVMAGRRGGGEGRGG